MKTKHKNFFKIGIPLFLLLMATVMIGSSCMDTPSPCEKQIYYLDADGDGYGTDQYTIEECEPKDGYVAQGGDCNDDNSRIHPQADEIVGNDIDENCNGSLEN